MLYLAPPIETNQRSALKMIKMKWKWKSHCHRSPYRPIGEPKQGGQRRGFGERRGEGGGTTAAPSLDGLDNQPIFFSFFFLFFFNKYKVKEENKKRNDTRRTDWVYCGLRVISARIDCDSINLWSMCQSEIKRWRSEQTRPAAGGRSPTPASGFP